MSEEMEGDDKKEKEGKAGATFAAVALPIVTMLFLGFSCANAVLVVILFATWTDLRRAEKDAAFQEDQYRSCQEEKRDCAEERAKYLVEKHDAESEMLRVRLECAEQGVYPFFR